LKKKATLKGKFITGVIIIFFVALFGFVLGIVTAALRTFWNFAWLYLAIPIPSSLGLESFFSFQNWMWLNLKFLSQGWPSYISCWIASLLVAIGIGHVLSLMKEKESRNQLINLILLIKKSLQTFNERVQIVLGIHPATGQISRGFSPQSFTIYSPDKKEKIDFLEFCLALAPNPTSGFQSLAPLQEIVGIDYPGKEYLSKTISFSIIGQDWAKTKNWEDFNKIKNMIAQRQLWLTLPKDIQELKKELNDLKRTIKDKGVD